MRCEIHNKGCFRKRTITANKTKLWSCLFTGETISIMICYFWVCYKFCIPFVVDPKPVVPVVKPDGSKKIDKKLKKKNKKDRKGKKNKKNKDKKTPKKRGR